MKKKILKLFTIIFFFYFYTSIINAQTPLAQDPKRNDWGYTAGFVVKWNSEKISDYYINTAVAKKYQTKNPIIVCLDKRGDAYKAGIKLYDEILEVNGSEFKGHFKTMDKFEVKIKRGSQILSIKNLTPMEFFSEDNICVPEFADRICLNEIFKNTYSKDMWEKVFECCEKNNVPLIPFIESQLPMKIDALANILSQKHINLEEKINYGKKGFREILNIEDFRKKSPTTKLPDQYHKLLAEINNLNLNKADFKDDKYIPLESEVNLERIKQYLDEIVNDEKVLVDEKNINILLIYIDVLFQYKELDYLEKKFKILQKSVNWSDNFSFKYYSDFYIKYLDIYYQKKDKKKFKDIIDLAIADLRNKAKTPEQIVNLQKIYQYKLPNLPFYIDNLTNLNDNYKEIFAVYEQLAFEFENFDERFKNEIIKTDETYIVSIYLLLGHLDSLHNYSKRSPYYSLQGLKLNEKYKLDEVNALNFMPQVIFSAINKEDFGLLTKTLLDVKNLTIKSKNNKNFTIAAKYAVPTIISPLVNIGLYKEAEELIQILEKNFNMGDENLSNHQKITRFFYYTSKSRVELNKGETQQAITSLEKNLKFIDQNLYSSNYYKEMDLLSLLIIETTVPTLLNLYLSIDRDDKFENLIKTIFNKNVNSLNKIDLETLKKNFWYQQWYRPLLAFFLKQNNQDQIKLISSFLDNNSRNIIQRFDEESKNIITNTHDIPDELLEISYLLSRVGNNKLQTIFLEKSHELSKKKYQNEIYKSLWKPSILKSEQKVKFLETVIKDLENKDLVNNSYKISQMIKNVTTTRDLNKAFLSKQGAGGDIFRDYLNLHREINLLISTNEPSLKNTLDFKNKQLFELEEKLKKNYPEYLSLQNIEYPSIEDIQKIINIDEIVLDYFISDNSFALVAIKKDDFRFFIRNFKSSEINHISTKIKKSLDGMLGVKSFDVKAAYELNKLLFLDFKEYFGDIKKFIIIPDSFLNEIPLHALPTDNAQNCMDCSKVKWNVEENIFVYLPSTDFYAKAEKKSTLKKLFKFDTKDVVPEEITKIFTSIFKSNEKISQDEKSNIKVPNAYFGMGDPDLYLEKKNTSKKTDLVEYKNFFRSIGNKSEFNISKIKEIYGPVAGSAEEVTTAANFFNSSDNLVLLKKDATETKIKNTDFSKFKVIHFATHGEVSGFIQGINQPFLVMSPPSVGSDIDDGLLMMNEIMGLNTNADIVILSACNTGSVEDQYSGSFSGLAKAFFISGSKSLLVSNWYVETKSTQKLVTKFIKNFSTNNLSFAENLSISMKEFIREDPKNSHPIYWAPFVFVGQDRVVNSPL
jgi:CHAT domain-containing protein